MIYRNSLVLVLKYFVNFYIFMVVLFNIFKLKERFGLFRYFCLVQCKLIDLYVSVFCNFSSNFFLFEEKLNFVLYVKCM